MNILLGYGYYPGTTGIYVERYLAQQHHVIYVGTPWNDRAGYVPNLDLARLAATLPFKVDLFLYIDSGNVSYAPTGLEALPFPTAAYLIDAWPPGLSQKNTFRLRLAPLFDYLFIAHLGAVEVFRAWREGLAVHWLPVACDPEIHIGQKRERIYDIGFVGQYNPKSYPDRVRLLDMLSQKYRMNDFRQAFYMHDMARVYGESKIGFNLSHGDILPMRFFEVLASGALLLTRQSEHNGQSQLTDLEEDEHFVTFKTLDDLLSKIDYYLQYAEERERIAHAGQASVLAHHTYAHRLHTLVETIVADGARVCAPVRSWSAEQRAFAYMELHSMMRMVDATMYDILPPSMGLLKLAARSRQLFYTLTAVLRRIRHE